MIITYQRENDCNYMIPESTGEITEAQYEPLRILEENPSNLFLCPSRRFLNGQTRIFYDISSRQSLLRLYEHNPIPGEVLYNLLDSMNLAMQECGRYLMDPLDLILDPEAIYISPYSGKVRFCPLPGHDEDAQDKRYLPLAEFILKHLDHSDPSAVSIGYRFFDLAGTANFSFLAQWPTIRDQFSDNASPDTERPAQQPADNYGQKEYSFPPLSQMPNDSKAQSAPASDIGRRKNSPKKGSVGKRIAIAAAAALSVLIYLLVLLFLRPDLTQAGGLFFLLVSINALVISYVYKSSSSKRGNQKSRQASDPFKEEEDFFRLLMEEADHPTAAEYRDGIEKRPGSGPFASGNMLKPNMPEDPYDEGTRFIDPSSQLSRVKLISLNIRRYPDLIPENNPALIGKSPQEADLVINQDVISRIHARIEVSEKTGEVFLTDMNSTNGTFVDGIRLLPNERRLIKEGQKISFASVHFQLKIRSAFPEG